MAKAKLPSPQERLELILLGLARRVPIRDLCRQAGVSRELFYRWMATVRAAALKALEAKRPGPKAVRPEKAEAIARRLQERVKRREKELRNLRQERDHWKLLAQTARRIIQRNAWGPPEPKVKKNAMRSRRPEIVTFGSGMSSGTREPQPRLLPGAGGCPEAPTGDGLPDASERSGGQR